MIQRAVAATILLALAATGAFADVLIVKDKRGRLEVLGLPSKVGQTEVTPQNWQRFVDESTGLIDRLGYDGVDFREREKRKPESHSADSVVDYAFTTEPDDLLAAEDFMATGDYAHAIGALQDVLDADVRQVFKVEADYRLGLCYLATGRQQNAAAHFAKWKWAGVKSKYTPEVYRLLGEIHTARKEYDKARQWYAKISTLEGATEEMKYLAQLGAVRADIAEREFGSAEANAKRIAASTANKAELAGVHLLALTLQAQAIFRAENKERLGEAEALLRGAEKKLEGVSATRQAEFYATFGDVLYAQGKLEEARFPYARVFCMFPEERGFVANALLNAGQCFLDLSGRQEDPGKKDEYLVKGMKLLAECAGRYRGYPAARTAAVAYRKHTAEYEAARKRMGEGEGPAEGEAENGK